MVACMGVSRNDGQCFVKRCAFEERHQAECSDPDMFEALVGLRSGVRAKHKCFGLRGPLAASTRLGE
eukprot:10623606-Alexandrium_andersonii.AAC.1